MNEPIPHYLVETLESYERAMHQSIRGLLAGGLDRDTVRSIFTIPREKQHPPIHAPRAQRIVAAERFRSLDANRERWLDTPLVEEN